MKVCVQCGKELLKKSQKKYCSPECYQSTLKKELISKICKCGKHFSVTNDRRNQKYCTKTCYNKFRIKEQETIQVQCKFCGKKFNTKRLIQKFCSNECSLKYNSINNKSQLILKKPRHKEYVPKSTMGSVKIRQIVASYIGRPLKKSEFVIHINRFKNDVQPENLYICLSRPGTVKNWPKESNLDKFKVDK